MPIDVVIFIPGICGSVLEENGITIWPGTPGDVIFKSYPDDYVKILATSTTLKATDVLRSVPLSVLGVDILHFDGYGRALKALEGMGFREANGTLIPFAYDWRRDIRFSAQALHDRLSDPGLAGSSVAIVAHSMGGLIARFTLEKIGIPAGTKIDLLALVAVPHLGAPAVLQNILGLRPEIFLSATQCGQALRDPRFPSAYQLLPHPGVPALLKENPNTGFTIQDPYTAAQAQALNLVPGSLQASADLAHDLPFMGPGFVPPCRYVAIAGNAQKTIVANYVVGNKANAKEEETGGDGTVPFWSAAPPGIPIRSVAATHGEIFKDDDTVAMLRAILRPGTPGARLLSLEPGYPQLMAQAVVPSVSTGATFSVAIVGDRPMTSVRATVQVTWIFEDGSKPPESIPILYEGGPIRSIPLEFTAPDKPAIVLVDVKSGDGGFTGQPASILVILP